EMGGGQGAFDAYDEEYQRLQERRHQTFGAIFGERDELARRFLAGCEKLGEEKRVVVVLDTVERLVYETDRIQQELGLGAIVAGLRRWLLDEWLCSMPNAVILVCGRPKPAPLDTLAAELAAAARACGAELRAPTLSDFEPDDTADYIQAVR